MFLISQEIHIRWNEQSEVQFVEKFSLGSNDMKEEEDILIGLDEIQWAISVDLTHQTEPIEPTNCVLSRTSDPFVAQSALLTFPKNTDASERPDLSRFLDAVQMKQTGRKKDDYFCSNFGRQMGVHVSLVLSDSEAVNRLQMRWISIGWRM